MFNGYPAPRNSQTFPQTPPSKMAKTSYFIITNYDRLMASVEAVANLGAGHKLMLFLYIHPYLAERADTEL